MAQTSKKPQQPEARPAAPARRSLTRKQREHQRQRQIIILSAVTVVLALIAILGGVVYEQLWLPSRPVAQANEVVLTRADYWTERRREIARTMGQSLYLATFGEQFAQQFLGQIGVLDSEIEQIRSAPINDATVDQWLDLQVIQQGAARQFNITASPGEIAQEMVAVYGEAFAPSPAASTGITPTAALAATAVVSPTATPEVAGTPAATATPEPTLTPTVTATASPTPLADVAQSREEQIITRLYEDYVAEINRLDPQRQPRLTIDDFRAGVRDQFLRQVLVRRVQEQLVPDASFTPSTEPSSIETRQIMLKVTVPMTATEAEREAAYAARRTEAEALLAEIRGGGDFETVARERSEDYNTRDAGGAVAGFDTTGRTLSGEQIDPAYLQAALALQPGDVSDLVRTPFGWHIIQLIDTRIDPREDQLQRARSEAFDTWIAEQRAAAALQRFPTVLPTPTPEPTGTPGPLPTLVLGADPSPTPIPPPTPIVPPGATIEPTATLTPGG
jgi:hypothetical protein